VSITLIICKELFRFKSVNVLCSFFEEVRRIGSPNYIPNEADVLRARTKTTGITETRFNMGQLSIQYVIKCEHIKVITEN